MRRARLPIRVSTGQNLPGKPCTLQGRPRHRSTRQFRELTRCVSLVSVLFIERSGSYLRRQPVPAEILDLQVFIDTVVRALAAQTALLDTAERRHFGRNQSGIDA